MISTLTAETIRRFAPRARQDYVNALIGGEAVFERWGINTPLRMAAFLATVCHETGGLTIVRENMNYTASRILDVWPSRQEAVKFAHNPKALANDVYGKRMGNERNGTNDDDGYRYRGGGLIQLTGRNSYERAGKAIGVDLGNNPELIEDATVSLQAACWEFSQHIKYCDMGERGWKSVCNGINRGNPLSKLNPIGWADRQMWYSKCCDALVVSGKVEDDLLRIGDRGELVKAMQERLAQLGYAVGRADGVYGSRTRTAVLAFQAENDLTLDGTIGPQTRTALNSESAVPMPMGERATETAKDLRNAGSETMKTAKALKDVAGAGATLSVVVGGAKQVLPSDPLPADMITTTKNIVTEISSWKSITNLIGDTFAWATSHWWIFAIVFAFIVYRWGSRIELRRLIDHTSGNNLGR